MPQTKEKIGLVVDSVADLPPAYLEEVGNIKTVPFHIYFKNEDTFYTEGVDLDYHQFYQKLARPESGLPKTQGPSHGEYLEAYKSMLERYDQLISMHASSKMSVAYSSAALARQMLPEADITLIDSASASMVLGLYALQAARAAKAGASVAEIVEMVEGYKKDTVQLFVVATMKYLKQSGRVNQMTYLIGSALHVKPVLTFRDGMGEPAGRELSQERAYLRIVKNISEKFGDRPILATVVHSEAPEQAQQLRERIMQRANVKELVMAEIGPTLGAHGGPGMVGAAAFAI